MDDAEQRELLALLARLKGDVASIQRLVRAMPGNKVHERLLRDLFESANSLEAEVLRELRAGKRGS
jgi:hypothetical protein